MQKIQRWLEYVHEKKITEEFDRVVAVVGDEGMGKSTLILQLSILWNDIIDADETAEELIERMVWERQEYVEAIVQNPKRSVIPVPDAARILFKKDSMDPDQKDVQKDMLQSRVQENLILLGFQYWGDIPTFLQDRRAHNILRIPSRGRVHGFSRSKIDEKVEDDEWPEPDLVDNFPPLDGTDIWKKYKRVDEQKKLELMSHNEDEVGDEIGVKEIVDQIQEEDPSEFISQNAGNKQLYFDPDLIEIEYDVSSRKAKKVKKVLQKRLNPDDFEEAVVA